MFHTYIYFKQINIFHNLSILFERHEKQFNNNNFTHGKGFIFLQQ